MHLQRRLAILVFCCASHAPASHAAGGAPGPKVIGSGVVTVSSDHGRERLVAHAVPGAWFAGWAGDTVAIESVLYMPMGSTPKLAAQFAPIQSLHLRAAFCPACTDPYVRAEVQVTPHAHITADNTRLWLNGCVAVAVDSTGASHGQVQIAIPRMACTRWLQPNHIAVMRVTGQVAGQAVALMESLVCCTPTITTPAAGVSLLAGQTITVRWRTVADRPVRSVALSESFDDGHTWRRVVDNMPNTGTCDWSVPHVRTMHARVGLTFIMDSTRMCTLPSESIASGAFVIRGDDATGLRVVRIEHGRVRLEIDLAAAAGARLQVVDLMGRRRFEETYPSGSGRAINTNVWPLASGVYFARLEQSGAIVTARFAVVR